MLGKALESGQAWAALLDSSNAAQRQNCPVLKGWGGVGGIAALRRRVKPARDVRRRRALHYPQRRSHIRHRIYEHEYLVGPGALLSRTRLKKGCPNLRSALFFAMMFSRYMCYRLVLNGTSRILSLVLAGAAVLSFHALSAQHQFEIQPDDVTITAGSLVTLEAWPAAAQDRNWAYQGMHPDTSMDVSDRMIIGANTMRFFSGPLFETTQFWFFGCNDLGCGMTRTVTVTVIPEEAPGPPAAFEGASDLGDDWWFSDWFGSFNIAFAGDGWLFHAQHGWMFLFADSTPDSVFLFDLASAGWFFTSSGTYPNLFSFGRNAWVFYFQDTTSPRQFVDLQSGEFFSLN